MPTVPKRPGGPHRAGVGVAARRCRSITPEAVQYPTEVREDFIGLATVPRDQHTILCGLYTHFFIGQDGRTAKTQRSALDAHTAGRYAVWTEAARRQRSPDRDRRSGEAILPCDRSAQSGSIIDGIVTLPSDLMPPRSQLRRPSYLQRIVVCINCG
jgi:hypothetical protein